MTEALKISIEPVNMEIVCEPYAHMTYRGYALVTDVKVNEQFFMIYLSAKSFSIALEPFVARNDNKFTGVKIKVSKESRDKMALYLVSEAD
jgi:hypothetical protein